MMTKIVSILPLFYIVFVGFNAYESYEEHLGEMDVLKSNIPKIQRKIKRVKKERLQVDKYLKSINEAKEQIELVAAEVENIQKKLPNDIDDTANLSIIKGVADNLNLREVFLTPKGGEDKGFYFTRHYEFRGKGTFLQILIFFEKVAENERLLNIKSLKMKRAEKQHRGRFQVIEVDAIIEAYKYNSKFKEDRGIDKIEKKYSKYIKKKTSRKSRKKK